MAEEKEGKETGPKGVRKILRVTLKSGAREAKNFAKGASKWLQEKSLELNPLGASVRQKEQSRRAISQGSEEIPRNLQRRARILEIQFREAMRAKNPNRARRVLGRMEQLMDEDSQAARWYFLHEEEYLGKMGVDEESHLSRAEIERKRRVREREKHPERRIVAEGEPRVTVYLGMIAELRGKVKEKGLSIPGYKGYVGPGGFYQTMYENMNDPDQILLVVLDQLNRAIRHNTKQWTLQERGRIDAGIERFRAVCGGDADQRCLDLEALFVHCDNLHQFIFQWWDAKRGGRDEAMRDILSQAVPYLGNGALWYLFEDPEVERAFHEIPGKVDVENGFIRGGVYKYVDPNTHEQSKVKVYGGDYGGAERMGHFLRWILGHGFQDGYQVCAANAYMAYKGHWWPEYALKKGWYDATKTLIYEYTDDGDVVLHTPTGWPSVFLAPNRMAEIWYEYLSGKKDEQGNVMAENLEDLTGDNIFRDIRGLSWRDKARMMIKYARSDFRSWTYTREQFENPLRYLENPELFGDFNTCYERQLAFLRTFMTQGEVAALIFNGLGKRGLTGDQRDDLVDMIQRAMFRKAVGIWNNLGSDERGNINVERRKKLQIKIIQNTLLNDRCIKKFDPKATEAEFIVKPVVDLDSKDKQGRYRIRIADLLYDNRGEGPADMWVNNFWTYESYLVKTEAIWEQLAKTDPKSLQEFFKHLLDSGDANEAYRQLYGEYDERTGERWGMLEKYEAETGWFSEAFSPMLMQGPFNRREHGMRLDEVAVPINELLRLGLFRRTFADQFRRYGLPGDWTELERRPLREMSQRVAKVLGGFNRKELWVSYMQDVLAGTDIQKEFNLSDDEMWWALVSFARFQIKRNGGEHTNEIGDYGGFMELREQAEIEVQVPTGRKKADGTEETRPEWRLINDGHLVNYFDFALDRDRAWGRQQLARLGRDGFDRLMATLGVGFVDQSLLKGEWSRKREFYRLNSRGELMRDVKGKPIIDKVETGGLFSFFMEKRDEEEIVFALARKYLEKNKIFNSAFHVYREPIRDEFGALTFERDDQGRVVFDDNHNPQIAYETYNLEGRTWGMIWSPYERDILFQRIIRDMRDGFTGKFITEQLKTDSSHKVGCRFKNPQTGRFMTLEQDNVVFQEQTIKRLDGTEISLGYHPVFPLFHEHKNIYRCSGSDPVWSVLQGTGEWYPGMASRLTPIHIHYQRDDEMYWYLMLVADAKFRMKIFEDIGKDWLNDLGWIFVATPIKLKALIEKMAEIESDHDWGTKWLALANCLDVPNMEEFARKRDEIGIFNWEQRQEREIKSETEVNQIAVTTGQLLQEAIPKPLQGLALGPLRPFIGRTWRETQAKLVGGLASGVIINAGVSAFTLTKIFDLYSAIGGLPVATPFGIPIPTNIIIGALYTLVTGLPGMLLFAQDSGIRKETGRDKVLYDQSWRGKIARGWQSLPISRSLFRERLINQSYESLVGIPGGVTVLDPATKGVVFSVSGSKWKDPTWDDLVNIEGFAKLLQEMKSKLQVHLTKS